MTKRRNQPLNARPSCSSRRWISRKTLIQVLVSSVLLALVVAAAIPALHLIPPSNKRSKDLGDLQIASEPTPTPRLAPRSGPMPVDPNAVYAGTIGIAEAENSTQSVHLAPVPTPTPAPQPAVVANETGSQSVKLSAADRRTAERERQKAELTRARLEALYQSHLISSADYKRGQDEYQSAIAKYHSVFNGNASTNDKASKPSRALQLQETAED